MILMKPSDQLKIFQELSYFGTGCMKKSGFLKLTVLSLIPFRCPSKRTRSRNPRVVGLGGVQHLIQRTFVSLSTERV